MKKLILVLGICFLFQSRVHALQTSVWLSSNVPTAVSTAAICGTYAVLGTTTTLRGILHGICINTAGTGNVQVFASTGTATSSITGLYSTATQAPCNFYDVESVNGLSYNKNGTADVTILYQCY